MDQITKTKDYAQNAIDQGEDKVRSALYEAERRLREGKKQVTQWATDVDKQAHDNPWPIIAGVGIGCLLLGVILGRRN